MARADRIASVHSGGLELGHFDVAAPYHCWREHGTERWLMFCTVDGRGRLGHEDGEIALTAGSLALIAPRTLHDYGIAREARRWRFWWAHVIAPPAWEPWLAWPETAPGIAVQAPDSASCAAVAEALGEAMRRAAEPGPLAEALAANAVERALILARQAVPADRLDPRLTRAIAICQRDFAEALTLAGIASRAGTSVSRLTALFRAQLGCSVRAYIERLRLDQARTLLQHSALPVAEVARRAGFSDPFYFSQRFRRVCGHAPSAWRRASGNLTPSSG